MNPGRLRHRVQLQAATLTPTSTGVRSEAWTTYGTVWAQIAPEVSREGGTRDQISPSTSHTVTLRYRDDVENGHRVLYRGRVFRVEGIINEEERQRFLRLACVEETL